MTYNFGDSKQVRKSNRDYKPVKKTSPEQAIAKAKEFEKNEWLRYMKRTQPEKVYTLAEQIAYVERKISAFELSVEKRTSYTKYKVAYLENLQSKKNLEDFNSNNVSGFKRTFGDLLATE